MGYEAWEKPSTAVEAEIWAMRWRGFRIAFACVLVGVILLLPKILAAGLVYYGVATAMPPSAIAYIGYLVVGIGAIVFLLHIGK